MNHDGDLSGMDRVHEGGGPMDDLSGREVMTFDHSLSKVRSDMCLKSGSTEGGSVVVEICGTAVILNKNLALFNIMMLRECGIVLFLLMTSQQGSTQVPSVANQAAQLTYASAPQQTIPGPSQQPSPGETLQTNLNLPLQTNPSQQTSTNPNLPPSSLSRTRGVRLQVNPYFNPFFQDFSNRNLLRGQASRYWNYGRPTHSLNYRNSYRRPFSNQALRFFAMNELFDFL